MKYELLKQRWLSHFNVALFSWYIVTIWYIYGQSNAEYFSGETLENCKTSTHFLFPRFFPDWLKHSSCVYKKKKFDGLVTEIYLWGNTKITFS